MHLEEKILLANLVLQVESDQIDGARAFYKYLLIILTIWSTPFLIKEACVTP